MIDNGALQPALTVVFALTAGYYVVRAAAVNPVGERVGAAVHALAGMAMVAMLWPWGMAIPMTVGVLVFGAAALWFAGRAVFGPEHALSEWYHAAMMASMTAMWMFMSRPMTGKAVHTDAAMAPMAAPDPKSPQWIGQVSLAAGVAYLVAAGCFAAVLLRTARKPLGSKPKRSGSAGASTLMAAGMSAFFLAGGMS